MGKATRIAYNPYENRLKFSVADDAAGPWHDLSETSTLLDYETKQVLFSNCAEDIVGTIDGFQNSVPAGLDVQFIGPRSDFDLLQDTVRRVNGNGSGAGPLTCSHIGLYRSADEALAIIRAGYDEIASEFDDYLPGHLRYDDGNRSIGDNIARFIQTVGDAIPICVIGNYSVGKSALLNALIGEEVLPSKVNPSTAKNVRVVRSDAYAMTLGLRRDDGTVAEVRMKVTSCGFAAVEGERNPLTERTCGELNDRVRPDSSGEVSLLRRTLDLLNDGAAAADAGSVLSRATWNVSITLPFGHSLLDAVGNEIVFYDTPGNDNAELDQQDHEKALEQLMGEQTNALPVLVTSRDKVAAKSNLEIRKMIDRYSDNFMSPSCLVVLSKGDNLTKGELDEPLPAGICNWHGKSIVLYATPIGALGERKGDGSPWHDDSYGEIYEMWKTRQVGPNRVTLPDYNVYPCGRRGTIDQTGAQPDSYATGIPSLEYEIGYYIDNYANYKKCVRGSRDLRAALDGVRRELQTQEDAARRVKQEADERKAEKKRQLLAELDGIRLDDVDGLAERLASGFADRLDDYCATLPQTMGDLYDELRTEDSTAMGDSTFNERLREHCQTHLIDAVYLQAGGARDLIIAQMTERAERFAHRMQDYVSRNESHFSQVGRRMLHEDLDREIKPLALAEVRSILESLDELFGDLAAKALHRVLSMTKDDAKAKERWIGKKRESFERRLRGGRTLFASSGGLFETTVFRKPIERYHAQLRRWAESYRAYIKEQLDDDNALLSDLEEDIRRQEAVVADLHGRLERVADVADMLDTVLEPTMTEEGRC